MEIKVGISKIRPQSKIKLNLRWVFLAFLHIALVIAIFGGFSWVAQFKSFGPASAQRRANVADQSFNGHFKGEVAEVAVTHNQESIGTVIVHQVKPPHEGLGGAARGHTVPLEESTVQKTEDPQMHQNPQLRPPELDVQQASSAKQTQTHNSSGMTQGKLSAGRFNGSQTKTKTGKCNLFKGKWIPNIKKPLYTNESCSYIQPDQNCLKNGHPAVKSLFWRWKPQGCSLPRFNAKLFLKLVRGKVWGYVGDSLARNQMQSLLCMLSQVEKPNNTYSDSSRANVHWHFPSYNFTVMVVWSPYLVGSTEDEFGDIPEGFLKLYLDTLDQHWLNAIAGMDVVILSTGHWLLKPAAYILENQIVGCHQCKNKTHNSLSFFFAYRKVLNLSLAGIMAQKGFTGTVYLRTHSIDHFEYGNWDTGGTCNRTMPLQGEVRLPGFKEIVKNDLYKIAVEEFKGATKEKAQNGCKLRLLDITYMSLLRPDGHPGKYRDLAYQMSVETGKKVPNDCLHWCLPGPIDAWNEVLLQMIQHPHL